MTRILVLDYSSYGHVQSMAGAVAEGAASAPGVEVDLARVPETAPEKIRASAGYVQDDAPVWLLTTASYSAPLRVSV